MKGKAFRILSSALLVLQIENLTWAVKAFHSGDGGSPGFGSIEQYRLHNGVKDPDFSAGAER